MGRQHIQRRQCGKIAHGRSDAHIPARSWIQVKVSKPSPISDSFRCQMCQHPCMRADRFCLRARSSQAFQIPPSKVVCIAARRWLDSPQCHRLSAQVTGLRSVRFSRLACCRQVREGRQFSANRQDVPKSHTPKVASRYRSCLRDSRSQMSTRDERTVHITAENAGTGLRLQHQRRRSLRQFLKSEPARFIVPFV